MHKLFDDHFVDKFVDDTGCVPDTTCCVAGYSSAMLFYPYGVAAKTNEVLIKVLI